MAHLTDIVVEDPRWNELNLQDLAERSAVNTLIHNGIQPSEHEVAILACDDERIAMLNADFRGKPTPTNVLSWPETELFAEADGGIPDKPPAGYGGEKGFLGDVAIAFDTCQREAKEARKPMHHHVSHLIVHGILHLLGYDHVRDRDATLMEGIETEILGKMGIPDPYRG